MVITPLHGLQIANATSSGVLSCQRHDLGALVHLFGRPKLLMAAALANEHVLVAGLVAVHVSHDPAREVPQAHTQLSTHACACGMGSGMPGSFVRRRRPGDAAIRSVQGGAHRRKWAVWVCLGVLLMVLSRLRQAL
jgi:hypothetical protein